ncbi:MAG: hypothetical protein H0W88_04070 [Parachlamydiaceae bacterium]|nr:hypothetical protein [Parachlamydiaceae bacterium]
MTLLSSHDSHDDDMKMHIPSPIKLPIDDDEADVSTPLKPAVAGDPTRTDSVQKFNILDKQNIALTGQVTITAKGEEKTVISTLPGSPVIAIPKETDGLNPSKTVSSNPWFTPSFVAIFSNIMRNLASMLQKLRYTESQAEIGAYSKTLGMAKDNAGYIQQIADLNAQEKSNEAAGCFVSASCALTSFVASVGSTTKAADDQRVKEKDQEIAEYTFEPGGLNENGEPLPNKYQGRLGRNPDGTDIIPTEGGLPKEGELVAAQKAYDRIKRGVPAPDAVGPAPPVPLADNDPALVDPKNRLGAAQAKLQKLQTEREERMNIALRSVEQRNESIKSFAENLAQGSVKLINAGIEKEKGVKEALKALNEGYMSALRTFMDNSSKNASEARSELAETCRNLTKIISDIIHAQSMSH